MEKKLVLLKIISFIFVCTIQFSANAYELLSSETVVSPGCEGGVLEEVTESFPLLSKGYSIVPTGTTKATVFSATGNANEMIMLRSNHSFSAQNNTNQQQFIKLSVILSTHDGQFTSNEYTYQLRPKELLNHSVTLYFNRLYAKPAYYKIYAQTFLSGSINSSTSGSNIVTVR
jgi:hypothetical protein